MVLCLPSQGDSDRLTGIYGRGLYLYMFILKMGSALREVHLPQQEGMPLKSPN